MASAGAGAGERAGVCKGWEVVSSPVDRNSKRRLGRCVRSAPEGINGEAI